MRTVSNIVLLLLLFPSCTKDKTTPPCTGVSMSGGRERFAGTWVWDSTLVEEWFDLGPSVYHYYTPETEGYEYYFIISPDGIYSGYKDNELVHQFYLSNPVEEVYSTQTVNSFQSSRDCSSEKFDITQLSTNLSNDSVYLFRYPLKFNDQQNHLRTIRNYFVRE